MTEPEICTAHAELHHLRADLIGLLVWAERVLDTDHNRQYIAEHMTASLDAILARETPPPRPF